MDIAIVSSANGGVGNFTFNLARGLGSRGNNVDLYIYSDPSRSLPRGNLGENVTVVMEESSPGKFLVRIVKERRSLTDHDVVHNVIFSPFMYLLQKSPFSDFASVNTVHRHNDSNPVEEITSYDLKSIVDNLYQRFELSFQPRLSRETDITVTVSNDAKNAVECLWGMSPEVVYHGVDKGEFSPDHPGRTSFREKYGVGDEDILCTFVGVLYPRKDIGTLVRAIPAIKDTHENSKFLIVGRGEQHDGMVELIDDLGIEEDVYVEKFIEDIASCYAASDIFINPSISEGFGIVYIEAMQSGCPVVAADIDVAREVIGDAGTYFEPGDSKALANRCCELIEDETLREDYRQLGIQRADQFTWGRAAKQYEELYRRAIQDAR